MCLLYSTIKEEIMKVSVYIEDNIKQVNFTPENKYERNIINSIKNNEVDIEFKTGTFSECYGGYVRFYNHNNTNGESLFMVIKEKKGEKKGGNDGI
jgi:hypothetical protein